MNLHNVGTVIGFDVRRTLMRPSFWLTSLSVPALVLVIFALMWFSNNSAAASMHAQSQQRTPFTYTDASGIVEADVAREMRGTSTTDAAAGAAAVREGRSPLHVDIPVDPTTQPVRIVGQDLGLVQSGQWQAIARELVQRSAAERIGDPRLTGVLDGVRVTAELWKDGTRAPGIAAAVAPGLFLLLLYMGVLMLGQQMLNITVEEKENRVTEMILTMLDPRVLIIGKVTAVLLVGIIQGLALLVPLTALGLLSLGLPSGMAAGPAGAGPTPDEMAALGLDGGVVLDPVRIALAGGLFTGGFLVFTGLLVSIGAVMPTAKDAGTAFGTIILAMFLPLYTGAMVVNEPTGVLSEFLTWFPLTAPVTALLRNALGIVPVGQAVGVVVVLLASATALLWLGVRLFRQGSISYDKRLSIRKALRSSR